MSFKIVKYQKNPILTPVSNKGVFDRACVYNPGAIVKDGKVYLLYRAECIYYSDYISRIGLAVSKDGFNFRRYRKEPVINKNKNDKKETRGCEDPRVVKIDNGYFLTYGAFPGKGMYLYGAISKDLIHWRKTGMLVPGREKAGALVQNYKYTGKYVMYFGEGDSIRVALSEDLKNWEIIKDSALKIRKEFFDSYLIEGGPPPIVTREGILVIYNSAKAGMDCENGKNWLYYAPGLAIFDKKDPTRLIYRSNKPIIEPTEYWEKYGKVNYVIFATGLVFFKGKWILYYGGADKSIGAAIIKF